MMTRNPCMHNYVLVCVSAYANAEKLLTINSVTDSVRESKHLISVQCKAPSTGLYSGKKNFLEKEKYA